MNTKANRQPSGKRANVAAESAPPPPALSPSLVGAARILRRAVERMMEIDAEYEAMDEHDPRHDEMCYETHPAACQAVCAAEEHLHWLLGLELRGGPFVGVVIDGYVFLSTSASLGHDIADGDGLMQKTIVVPAGRIAGMTRGGDR